MKLLVYLTVLFILVAGAVPVFASAAGTAKVCQVCKQGSSDSKLQCQTGLECKSGVCQQASSITVCNPLKSENITDILDNILRLLFNLSIVVAPIMVVIGGFMMVTSAGSSEKVTTARNLLLWTAIGFSVILLSRGIVGVIRGIIGL